MIIIINVIKLRNRYSDFVVKRLLNNGVRLQIKF